MIADLKVYQKPFVKARILANAPLLIYFAKATNFKCFGQVFIQQ